MESGLSWYSEDGKAGRKLDACGYDTGSLKTEAPSKWRKKPPSLSDELSVKEEARKPQSLGASGSFKKSRNPPVGVTSPITHTSQSMLKLAGEIHQVLVCLKKIDLICIVEKVGVTALCRDFLLT